MVLKCIKMLKRVAMKNNISLAWIPGHRGIKDNEPCRSSNQRSCGHRANTIGAYSLKKGLVEIAIGRNCMDFTIRSLYWKSSIQKGWSRWLFFSGKNYAATRICYVTLLVVICANWDAVRQIYRTHTHCLPRNRKKEKSGYRDNESNEIRYRFLNPRSLLSLLDSTGLNVMMW